MVEQFAQIVGMWPRRARVWLLGMGFALLCLLAAHLGSGSGAHGGPGSYALAISFAVFFAALACEFMDSSLGMGYGTTLTPLLLLAGFEPLQIVPAILFSEALTGAAAGFLHHRDGNVDFLRDGRARRTAFLLAILSGVGAIAAVALALHLPKRELGIIIAGIILAIGVLIVITARRTLRFRAGTIVVVGAVAAFNKGLSGGGYGPLVTAGQVVSGLPARHAVAITSVAEALTCVIGLAAYLAVGKTLYWPLTVPLALGALLSVPLATATVRRLRDDTLRRGVGIITLVLGGVALLKVLG